MSEQIEIYVQTLLFCSLLGAFRVPLAVVIPYAFIASQVNLISK